MTSATLDKPLRPLPAGATIPVAGTSFRPHVANTARPGYPVLLRHDPTNTIDPNAVEVLTLKGVLVGFVPASLAARLSGTRPGGEWNATITDVLPGRKGTGLRITLGDPR